MLLLDAGNTRIKWALTRDGAWLHRGSLPVAQAASLPGAFAGLPRPGRIIAANVAGDATAQHILSACAHWECAVEFISAQAGQCGIRNGYDQAPLLGSDRWAALIAAWDRLHTTCLVVNCGTATTVDALSDEGVFLGGLILPGLDLMQRSLASATAQLELAPGHLRDFPSNTADAIYSGVMRATTGAIRLQHALLNKADAPCVLDGGAADLIQPHLGLPMLREADLVLKGLQLIGMETGKARSS